MTEYESSERVELGNDLELWRVDIDVLQEQMLNARVMVPEMFNQLSENIRRRKGLESLAFCAKTDKGIEIVSGHHRLRAARKAGIKEVWVLVDVSNLSRDQIRAKQLAHNSIQGQDNTDLIRQIFAQIADAESRIEAFVDMPDLNELAGVTVELTAQDLGVEFDVMNISINFLPVQFKEFDYAMTLLQGTNPDVVYLAQRGEYDELIVAMDKVAEQYDIRSTPTIFSKMAQIVVEHLGGVDDDAEA
jgi:hypothetical protein